MNVLYSVSDANYLLLTCALIRSVAANEPNIDQIIIGSLGLKEYESTLLESLDSRVRIIEQCTPMPAEKLHDSGWVSRTLQKTVGLVNILELGHRVFMLDADCVVLRPFVDDLAGISCIGVCRRERPAVRKDIRLDHIASIFVGEGREAVNFVKCWVEVQKKLIDAKIAPPYETPALCRAIRYWEASCIQDIDETLFSKQSAFDHLTRVAHLKSNKSEKTSDILESRFEALVGRDKEFVERYF
jgi:hypothetical protein